MKKCALFCGGYSSEYDISLKSAQNIYANFPKEYEVIKVITPTFKNINFTPNKITTLSIILSFTGLYLFYLEKNLKNFNTTPATFFSGTISGHR